MGSNLNTNLWTGESSGGGSAPVVNNGLTLSTAGGSLMYGEIQHNTARSMLLF